MNERGALLAAIMFLPPEKREKLWNELVELGIIREAGAT